MWLESGRSNLKCLLFTWGISDIFGRVDDLIVVLLTETWVEVLGKSCSRLGSLGENRFTGWPLGKSLISSMKTRAYFFWVGGKVIELEAVPKSLATLPLEKIIVIFFLPLC